MPVDRRRFLKYAGATGAVVGASALGLNYLLKPQTIPANTTPTQISTPATTFSTTASVATSLPPSMPNNPTHLLAKVEDFQRLWRLIVADPTAAALYKDLKHDGDTFVNQPSYSYDIPDVNGLLRVCRRVVRRIYTWGIVYRLGGNDTYRQRAWTELQAMAKFPDWHPAHFLDTAEMTHAFAIGYDWFPWNDEQRATLREALVEKGLKPALQSYRGEADFGWWVKANHNWNLVCNGGIGMGALALLADLPDLSHEILGYALKSMPLAMNRFGPDGGWGEGPVYWNYGTLYSCVFLSSLQTALGQNDGLSQTAGFSETGYFPIYATGPTGLTFNFADGDSAGLSAPQMFWLAREFSEPVFAWFPRTNSSLCGCRASEDLECPGPCIGEPLSLLWYQPQYSDPISRNLPVVKYFRGVEVVSIRDAWSDQNGVFVGFKAGDNKSNHGHLDLATFVLDALDQRWAIDLGADDYNLPGYFDTSSKRWTYYRMRAEGHNTLVINPSRAPDQDPMAAAKIVGLGTQPGKPFAIANLTFAYPSYVLNLQRGIAVPNRNSVIVQDELTTNQPIELWWFMHTVANVQLSEDKHEATLDQGSARLWCGTVSPSEASFTVMDAKPLGSSPNPTGQDQNLGIRKLAIHLKGVTSTRLSVVMVPLAVGQEPPTQMPAVVPLKEW